MEKEKFKSSNFLLKYKGELFKIFGFEMLSKIILFAGLWAYKQIAGLLLWNLQRPAFTSGDLPYILRSWQGITLVILGFIALIIYTVFDINITVIMGSKILHQEKVNLFSIIKESVLKLKNFKSFSAVVVILYVSFIVPLTGVGLGISLTDNFVIPDFILQVINSKFALSLLYNLVLIALGVVGFFHIFTFHYVLIENKKIGDALRLSRQLVKKKWKNFIKEMLFFTIKAVLALAAVFVCLYVIPQFVVESIKMPTIIYHTCVVFFTFMMLIAVFVLFITLSFGYIMQLTVLFYNYTNGVESFVLPKKRKHKIAITVSSFVVVLTLVLSIIMASSFDEFFPKVQNVNIIAHRGGGNLSTENTVESVEVALENGVKFSEIDVQRTKDNHYIINHDDNFKRCCGDDRTPSEMTLDEIKQLKVKNLNDPLGDDTEVATIEEMLDTAKDRSFLYIELKGVSADTQMAEDIVSMIKERGMENQTMLISLKYQLIDYVETKYPQINTGYLCFFSFGAIEKMNCDALLLEAETATAENVSKIHESGKLVNVWTVNSFNSMFRFAFSEVDGIITDEVLTAYDVWDYFSKESDIARVLNWIIA